MSPAFRISHLPRFLTAVILLVGISLNCNVAQGQIGNDQGETADGGSLFQPEEPDLSAFEGIERSESIGTATTQGFGLAAESAGVAGTGGFGGAGGFGGGGLGGLGGLFGGLGGAFGGQGASSAKPIIRVRLKSAINIPPRPAEAIERSANRTLSTAIPYSRGGSGVYVTMDGRRAILTGTVGNEKARRMSELLMKLEPGVDKVDNQVVVEN